MSLSKGCIEPGDIVKYSHAGKGEEDMRLEVLEVNGDRALVVLIDESLPIPPSATIYLTAITLV